MGVASANKHAAIMLCLSLVWGVPIWCPGMRPAMRWMIESSTDSASHSDSWVNRHTCCRSNSYQKGREKTVAIKGGLIKRSMRLTGARSRGADALARRGKFENPLVGVATRS